MTAKKSRGVPVLLVLAPAAGLDALRRELAAGAFDLVAAASTAEAEAALRSSPVEAAVVSAEAPAPWVDELLACIGKSRPGIPVLAVRRRNAEEPAAWRARGVGVLREPILPGALARSVSAVLGLRHT
ncbi:MAG TPA: hypothetical protein VIR81_15585 [Myxococcales bacterium]